MDIRYRRGFAVTASLTVAAMASANGTVTGVSATKIGNGVRVVVKGEDLTKPAMVSAYSGSCLILEFGGKLQGRSHKFGVWAGGVTTVNYGQNTNDRVRVVVRFNGDESPKLTKVEDGWAVTFGATETASTTLKATKAEVFPNSTGPLESVVVSSSANTIPTDTETASPQKPVHPAHPKAAPKAASVHGTKGASHTADEFPDSVGPLDPVSVDSAANSVETTVVRTPIKRAPTKAKPTKAPSAAHPHSFKKHVVHPKAPKTTNYAGDLQIDGGSNAVAVNLGSSQNPPSLTPRTDAVATSTPTTTQTANTPAKQAPATASIDNVAGATGKKEIKVSDHSLTSDEIAKIQNTVSAGNTGVVQLAKSRNYPTLGNVTSTASTGSTWHGSTASTHSKTADQGPLVSLDFVNTEVSQIVKALALQSGASIVLAPEAGKAHQVTVTLTKVPLTEALNLVTTVSGLSYTKIGSAYVITSAANSNYVQQALGGKDPMLDTRVVPIYSSNLTELKGAVMSSISQMADHTEYELILPGERGGLVKQVQRIDTLAVGGGAPTGAQGQLGGATGAQVGAQAGGGTGAAGAAGGTGAAEQGGAAAGAQQTELHGNKSAFIMIVGPANGIDDVESKVKEIDQKLCAAQGIEPSGDPQIVRISYPVQSHDMTAGQLASALKPGIASMDFKVDLYWPPDTFPNQVMIVEGRRNEVNKVLDLLKTLDSSGYGDDTQIYDVKFADPRALREDVMSQVPGLRASLVPASAGNPRIYVPGGYSISKGEVTNNQQQQTSTAGGPASGTGGGGAQGSEPASSATKQVKGDVGQVEGLQQPFNDFEPDAQPMKLVLHGTADQIDKALKYMKIVDVTPKQVAIEMRVMELSKEDALKYGLDWNILTGGAVKTINLNQALPVAGSNSASLRIGGPKNWTANVTATLDQIANKNNLIARPNLLALDGRETEIFIGDVIRYVTSIQSTQQGTTVTTDSLPVGVRLAVLPRVGGDGTLTMDIRPVVSFLKSFTQVPGGGELPQTSVRISQSTVNIRDGETIAIGGLIQDQDVRQMSKVPILGDLPFIGALFRQVNNDRQRSEVVFFLTAKVVDNDNKKNAANPDTNAAKNPPEIGPGSGKG